MDQLRLGNEKQLEYMLHRKGQNKGNNNSQPPRAFKKKIMKGLNWTIVFVFVYLQLTLTLPNLRKLGNMKCTNWFDTNCIKLMWKGDAVGDLSKINVDPYQVSLVISACGEEMDLFTNYANDVSGANITVKSTTIISGPGCPEATLTPPGDQSTNSIATATININSRWKYPILQFIEWISSMTESPPDELQALPEYYNRDNTFVLFLNGNSIKQKNIRKLDEILQSTIETGFGCVQRPADKMSYYHNGNVLKDSSDPHATAFLNYDNFGDYLKQVNLFPILTRELIPVCYGSSFALSSRDLFKKSLNIFHSITKTIVTDFEQHEQEKVIQYIERVLASIFSYPLPTEKAKKLMKYTTGVNEQSGSYTHDFGKSYLYKFFRGDTMEEAQLPDNLRLTLVMSYCNEDTSWTTEFLKNYDLQNVTIYSKCNSTINGYTPPGSEIIQLPNYGRCDHTYAHWGATRLGIEDATENHFVIFLKASRSNINHIGMLYRSLEDMIRIANVNGFACGYESNNGLYFHSTARMRGFSVYNYKGAMIKSPYTNFGHWLDAMGINLPEPSPVCYGGNFLAKASLVYSKQSQLKKMEESLTRGDSIEEGHFAERTWAGLLSYPTNSNQTDVLQSIPTEVSSGMVGYVGHLRMIGR